MEVAYQFITTIMQIVFIFILLAFTLTLCIWTVIGWSVDFVCRSVQKVVVWYGRRKEV